MEQIVALIRQYGLEPVILAVLVNVLTGAIKLPIKAGIKKLGGGKRATGYIVFLPIVLSFLTALGYTAIFKEKLVFNGAFIRLWLTSGSLSLTIYAIFEKVFPSRKKLLSESEVQTSKQILENIRELVESSLPKEERTAKTQDSEAKKREKIVLRGKRDAETQIEKQ